MVLSIRVFISKSPFPSVAYFLFSFLRFSSWSGRSHKFIQQLFCCHPISLYSKLWKTQLDVRSALRQTICRVKVTPGKCSLLSTKSAAYRSSKNIPRYLNLSDSATTPDYGYNLPVSGDFAIPKYRMGSPVALRFEDFTATVKQVNGTQVIRSGRKESIRKP